ncbi:MAG: 4-hydroxyphenylacetate 3-hydroxylase N-terminal domain-containing protein, partial [Beijerinckiaceae bacterium]
MRDGKAYIASLKDGREVWIDGERVSDVTLHPALAPAIQATAHLYDMQHEPALAGRLSWSDPETGQTAGRTFQPPRTWEDLAGRREATRLWMETSFGFMGRAPDFLNTVLMCLKAKSSHFAKLSAERQKAVEAYVDHAAQEDLFLTHGLNDPLPDKTKARHAQNDKGVVLHVEEETADGLIVSGAKVVATAAAYANDALMFPRPNNQVA